MPFTKFATFEQSQVLEVKGSPVQRKTASLDKLSDFDDYRTGDGYMYVRIRAISSRTNKNHDGWPSVELAGSPDILDKHRHASGFTVEAADGNEEYGFATFMGKPFFVDHNNSDPKRARGVVVDAKLRVLPKEASLDKYYSSGEADPEHLPPTEVELLIECDAKKFPKLAKAIREGDIDGFSMGCDVEKSKCSHCGHVATNPDEYCSHILMKGANHDYKTAEGKRISRKSYENCYGVHFFEISAVFDPADETALTREIRAGVQHEGIMAEPQGSGEWPNEHGEWPWDVKHEPEIDEQGNETLHLPPHYPNVLEYLERLDRTPEVEKAIQEHRDYLNHIGYPIPSGNPADPRMGARTAESPLPQSFQPSAPEEVDTLRKQQVCPVCGEDMEGDTCEVCGYEAPPEGFENPDLTKAKDIREEFEDADSVTVPEEGGEAPGGPPPGAPGPPPGPDAGAPEGKQPGSFMQQHARKAATATSLMGDMNWTPELHPRIAARINQSERPIKPTNKPATNEPTTEKVISDQDKPITSSVTPTPTMLTAQNLIRRAKANKSGDTMSTRTADGPTAPDAAADTRTDVEGVGGVIDASNEQASQADAQTDVTGIGSTGVTDVEAEGTQDLPTAGRDSDDAGFNKDKTTEDSGPTKTYDDSDGTEKAYTDGVTNESLEGNQNKGSSARAAGDAAPWPDDEINGGSANKGTEPVDAVGKAQERVNVLDSTTTPDNNSGPTTTWSGTDGNGVLRQQDPVTRELQENNTDNAWTSHTIAAMKVADTEVELGLIDKDEKYNRMAELAASSDEHIAAIEDTLTRTKTAGLKRLAEARTAGVARMPSFTSGRAAVGTGHYDGKAGKFAQGFQRVATDGATETASDESTHDAELFI